MQRTFSKRLEDATLIARPLEWVVDNLRQFDPYEKGRAFDVTHGQRVAELAVLLYCYVHLTGDRNSDAVARIRTLLQTVQENPGFSDRLLASPREFVLVCNVYSSLRLLGHDDKRQREMIERVLDAGILEQAERLPHRMMDVRLALEWGGFSHSWPSWSELLATSLLSRPPKVLWLDEAAAYAVTHVILFLHGFGTRETPPVTWPDLQALRRMLSALLIRFCQEGHWDLVGELVLCWECVGLPDTAVYRKAWASFAGVQNDDGSFPGPERKPGSSVSGRAEAESLHPEPTGHEHPSEVGPQETQRSYFAHHYHTTLVAVIALCCRLKRRRTTTPATTPHERAAPFDGRRRSPSRRELSAAVRRANEWLDGVLDAGESRDDRRADVFSRVLLGGWMCEAIEPTLGPRFPAVARRVWRALGRVDDDSPPDYSRTSPALKLVTAALLSSEGLRVPALDAFLHRAAATLQSSLPQDGETDLHLCEKRLLLHALGLHPRPKLIDGAGFRDAADRFSLTASRGRIDDLLLRTNSITAYGTTRVALDRSDFWIAEMMAGVAMHFLHRQDFQTGCRWLRATSNLSNGGASCLDECISWLYLQQRPEGAFGFLGGQEALLKDTWTDFRPDADLYLPVTIECLWTLGETSDGGWRLFDSLPQAAQAGQGL